MKTRRDRDYISFFDEISGLYIRTGIIENGKDSGSHRSSFWSR